MPAARVSPTRSAARWTTTTPREQDGHIAGVLLSGEGALTRNMCEYLGAALHLPVSLGDPLQHVPDNKTKLSQPELQAMSPRLAIALGLALDDEE